MRIGSRVMGHGSRKILLLFAAALPLAACCLTLIISGCGYANRSLIAPDKNGLFVRTFANKIDITKEASTRQRYNVYKPFLETRITDALIDRLIYDGSFKIVAEGAADLVLEGELINYFRQPLKYSDAKEVQEYRLNVMINFTLKDLKTGKFVMEEKNLTADTTYFVGGKSAKTEDAALDSLLEDLSRRVVSRIVNAQWQQPQ